MGLDSLEEKLNITLPEIPPPPQLPKTCFFIMGWFSEELILVSVWWIMSSVSDEGTSLVHVDGRTALAPVTGGSEFFDE